MMRALGYPINLPSVTQNECIQTGTLVSGQDGTQQCYYANGGCRPVSVPINVPFSTSPVSSSTILIGLGLVGVIAYLVKKK